MEIIGNDVINRGSAWASNSYTYLDLNVVAPVSGTLTQVSVWPNNVGLNSWKLKIFRDDGTNYLYIGGTDALTVTADQKNDFACSIAVQSGDIIGVYINGVGGACETDQVGVNAKFYTTGGDVMSNSLKTAWTTSLFAETLSIGGIITVAGTNMQINIGDVWKNVTKAQINIGDVWKNVTKAQINIGDVWKTIF